MVPLCFEKSMWTVVAMLAVLKAGGTFVLLDASQPLARLEAIISQINNDNTVALASASLLSLCQKLPVRNILVVDALAIADLDTAGSHQKEQPATTVQPGDAAYAVFTSGTTGTPKGVMIEHRQLVTSAVNCGNHMGFRDRPRVLQFASYAFDACILETITTLVYGGTICVPSEWERKNAIVPVMRRLEVTTAFFTPSLLTNLAIKTDDIPSLNTLIVGGESIPSSLVEYWSPRLRLILAYGPTECCVICFTTEASQQHAIAPGELGRPFGARAWIVKEDDYNQLAEIGEPGELLIEGPILARGYLNDAQKTAKQFILGPTWTADSQQPGGGRFYRTGDLARYLDDDGTIGYVGRIDNQVKIRGQRLELSEVEQQLCTCLAGFGYEEACGHLVVVEAVSFPASSSKQLVAFISLSSATDTMGCFDWGKATDDGDGVRLTTSPAKRKRFNNLVSTVMSLMEQVLPRYAVPTVYLPLHDVPFAISGKVDRKRLRTLAAEFSVKELAVFVRPSRGHKKNGPATADENNALTCLRSLWAQTFHAADLDITPDDDFLSLGGDSVLAIKLASAARTTGLDLTVDTIFKHPVLSDMAAACHKLSANGNYSEDIVPPFSLCRDDEPGDLADILEQAASQCGVSKEHIEDVYPCSLMQLGLLASSIQDPDTYVMDLTYKIPPWVDTGRLRDAWEAVARRTEVLRTRFIEHAAGMQQVVVCREYNQGRCLDWETITVTDSVVADGHVISSIPPIQKRRKMRKMMCLGQPMSSFTLLHYTHEDQNSESFLVWKVHHALVDGWSAGLIATSVEQEYMSSSSGTGSPGICSAPPSTRFNRFIRHVRDIERDTAGTAREFWKHQLTDAPVTIFPSALEAPSRDAHTSIRNTVVLERKMPSFRREAVTAGTMVQAAWVLLAGIYSNASDVVVGMTVNGRTEPLPQIDVIAGPTIATVPFRVKFEPEQELSAFLGSVREQYLAILPFQQYGFQNIQRVIGDAAAACTFRSLLVIQSANEDESLREVLRERTHKLPSVDSTLIMECDVSGDESMVLRATFDDKDFSHGQVRRIFLQLEDLLERIQSSDSTTRVSDLQKIGDADMRQIAKWNPDAAEALKTYESCVHDLIHDRARQTSGRTDAAICAWDGELTYAALDEHATRLAHHLQKSYNVGPESLVAIAFEKSMWVVVAMLAVLKAGGGCVPMDPTSPSGRLETLLGGIGANSANLILTSSTHAGHLCGLKTSAAARVLVINQSLIDTLDEEHTEIPPAILSPSATPSTTAFVVFTSGTTGQPKGIVLEHRAFVSSAIAHGSFIKLNRYARVLQFAAHTFDVSIGDMFATLIHGGCVCIPSDHDRLNNLGGAITSLRATHASLTPTVSTSSLSLLPEDVPTLQVLVSAGEAMTREVIDKWAGHVELVNMYGPAECSVYCIGKGIIKKGERHFRDIGRGVGAVTWIVDPRDPDRLVPIGAVGEILIEGPVLARGYLGNEAQTGASFITDPAWLRSITTGPGAAAGRRFYLTGDLAAYNSDGCLVGMGRKDDDGAGQVKLHGQRLEIGEVEYQMRQGLMAYDGARGEAAATMATPSGGQKTLVGFIVTPDQAELAPDSGLMATGHEALRHFTKLRACVEKTLASNLPRFMIPALYIPLMKLPLSASGKIDRKRLQALVANHTAAELSKFGGPQQQPATKQSELKGDRKRPLNQTERIIGDLWKVLLQTDDSGDTNANDIDIDTNFFHLGGNSVTAMRLVALARRQHGLTLSVSDTFKHPILSDLACKVQETIMNQAPITPEQDNDIAPFSLLHQDDDPSELSRMAARQCQIQETQIEDIYPCTPMAGWYALGALEDRLPGQARDYQWHGAYRLPPSIDVARFQAVWDAATPHGLYQVVVDEPAWWTPTNSWDSVEAFLEHERFDNMELGSRQLRLAILEISETEKYFVIAALHSIYDGWSLNLLFHEIETAYFSSSPTPPPPSYRRYVKYITRDLDRAAIAAHWTAYLAGATTPGFLSEYPQKRCMHTLEPPSSSYRVETTIPFSPSHIARTSSIATLPRMAEMAVALALARDTGTDEIVISALRTCRDGAPAELCVGDIVGPTLTLVPLRVRIDRTQTVRDLLATYQAGQLEDARLGAKRLGLRLERTLGTWEEPWGFYVELDLGAGSAYLCLSSYERFLSVERGERQHAAVRAILGRMMEVVWAEPEFTVGELLEV
ncbi:hypothetical protein QBC47DRAFT_450403 [Echria macrotheca]|uniref:Carrier domain-containing protein n=1 Tax=Echria macrotheca TaxID=438768 RepID=A0AAJ0FDW4_9PEZI|nr:hypothetical protein QBC47DRAFT_450403 [Echria macrotheca]